VLQTMLFSLSDEALQVLEVVTGACHHPASTTSP
jgi:hypothetical protein